MRLATVALIALVTVSVRLAAPAGAALPPSRDDPCSAQGRNTCGTLGVGFYKDAGYGVRWFGDYRGAVPGVAHLFCIDARYWYASASYGYEARSALGLRNRDGRSVSLENQERMAYAIWTFGRTRDAARQAAVMLYTHALMGDLPSAEVDPAAVSSAVSRRYRQIARDADRYHGPYRIEARFEGTPTVAKASSVLLRVVAASGSAVPGVDLALSGDGASGVPARVRTGAAGAASVSFVPVRASGLQLHVDAVGLASTRPRIYAATSGAAAVNGQRLAAPSAQLVRRTFVVRSVRVAPALATEARTQEATPGAVISDRVVVTGLGGLRVRVQAELWGPFASPAEISCAGAPYWSGGFVADGDGTYETAAVRLRRVGYYTYRESISGRKGDVAYRSGCGEAPETTVVRAHPTVTSVGDSVVRPGHNVDRMRVQGLDQKPTRVRIELFGPFASSRKLDCASAPRWTAAVSVTGNGEYRSPPVPLRRPGVYLFRHVIPGSRLTRAFATPCNESAFTTVVAPRILTGRGDSVRDVAAVGPAAPRPVRLRLGRLGIDAPISPVGIDVRHGTLAIPGSLRRLGWWSDSSAPTARSGSVLVAGHVDGANSRIGAFFPLRLAHAGDVVDVTTANEAVHRYVVTSIRRYPKRRLPLDIYSRSGAPRLVLVTCGGRFDPVTGHYPDNVVVTARPD